MVKGSYKDETTEREEIVRKRGGGNCREIEKGIFYHGKDRETGR